MTQASSRNRQVKTMGLLIPTLLQGEVEGWRNTGWAGVTQTTLELLNYWFEEERDGANFHPCQQKAIETIIYCHEILGVENPYQLYEKFAPDSPDIQQIARSKVLQDELNPIKFPKYCLKMATGSGKTWVLNAFLVWHYFNALNNERPGLFTFRFLIVTPGREVQKRILQSLDSDLLGQPLFIPPGTRWKERFYFERYTPTDFRENLTLTDAPFLVVTNWQQFRFAKESPSVWDEFVGEREDIPKAEILADLLTEYPDICVLNDEAHHVHATKRPSSNTGKDEELIWRRFMTFLHNRQCERHSKTPYRVFKQIDFSATPFYGSGDNKDYFPHIVYDYDLTLASADMLVKQLFLEQRQGTKLADLDFRAERAPSIGKKRGEILGLSRGQKIMLEIGKSKLEQLTLEFQASGVERKPVMLVLAEETEVANLVGEHFNTLTDENGNYYDQDRLVVYHSNLKEADYKAASDKLEEIDNDNQPLKVVVSVLSVREGFDRHNICVIVMLRASEADLLLEQVVGRGLRIMFPSFKPEYDQIQDLKQEARRQLLAREAPSNAFDCLFLVEHPKFKDFYENYLIAQGYAVASGDSSGQKVAGDLVTVDADVTKIPRYDITWSIQLFDNSPIPNIADIDINSLGYFLVRFDLQKKMSSKTMITDVHVETETKAKTWTLENDYFDYNFFLQQIARTVTQTGKMTHLTALSAEIAALVDEYVSRRLFTQDIDFTDPDNYQVLQSQQIVDFIVDQVRAAITRATGDLQYQPGAIWRKLSDVPRLLMRQSNMVPSPRCIYPYQAVQTVKGGFERTVINKLLNPSPEILAFAKLDRKHDLIISWRDGKGIQRKYEPDFVIKTANVMRPAYRRSKYSIKSTSGNCVVQSSFNCQPSYNPAKRLGVYNFETKCI
jgi:type III restriction enzyme